MARGLRERGEGGGDEVSRRGGHDADANIGTEDGQTARGARWAGLWVTGAVGRRPVLVGEEPAVVAQESSPCSNCRELSKSTRRNFRLVQQMPPKSNNLQRSMLLSKSKSAVSTRPTMPACL